MTGPQSDIAAKRCMLMSTRMRFSASGTSLREQAVAKVIEQNLASASAAAGLTDEQITGMFDLGTFGTILRPVDVRQGLASLVANGRLTPTQAAGKRAYVLSEEASKENKAIIEESERAHDSVLRHLFENAPGGHLKYKEAFVQLLCRVFATMGDVYVRFLTGSLEKEAPHTDHKWLNSQVEETCKHEAMPGRDAFELGVRQFFQESTPDFDRIKWSMAQNYYVAKALGVDESAGLLSSDMLKGARFYLDTNVLIAGLIPESKHYGNFLELSKACESMGITMMVAYPTVQELKAVISSHAQLLKEVISVIPDATRPKVRSFLLEAFVAAQVADPAITIDDFLLRFQAPIEKLKATFGIDVVDDSWFDQELDTPQTTELAKAIMQTYNDMRKRPKRRGPSVHDALLLRWVFKQCEGNNNTWFVTLDLTLSSVMPRRDPASRPMVLTIEALLQWLTPQRADLADTDRIAAIYAQALRYHLLPRDVFFDLRDFKVFADMEIETSQLPAADVEACVLRIKKVLPDVDPGQPADREKLMREVERYFAGPDTKYQQELKRLEGQVQDKDREIAGRDQALAEAAAEKKKLEDEIVRRDKREAHRKLVWFVTRQSLIAFAVLVILEAVLVVFVWNWGEGDNPFQKITNSSWWFAIPLGAVGLMYPFLLGRKGMRLLKFWRGEGE